MPGPESSGDWQQHYPTYHFHSRDIVLAEYEAAGAVLETEERLFLGSANFTLLIAAGLSSLALGSLDRLYRVTEGFLSGEALLGVLVLLTVCLAVLSLWYFADRQKTILFAKRKMIVLRTMLGLDYGRLQLILPNWRLEGANQPFAVRLFPGWTSYVAYPFWVIGLFTSAIVFLLIAHYFGLANGGSGRYLAPEAIGALSAGVWLVLCAYLFRATLYDTHERTLLVVCKCLSRVLRVALVPDTEYVIYRAQLATYELVRLGIDIVSLRDVLMFVEDRTFERHCGISFRGVVRAIRDLRRQRPSGGSTITQQMVRSLFIVDYHKRWRRKIVEMILALWAERVFRKDAILRFYLASVRFANRKFGITEASRHFLGRVPEKFTKAEAFVLAERIGNIRDRIILGRVDELLGAAIRSKVLSYDDASEVIRIYDAALARDILVLDDSQAYERLRLKWSKERP